MKRRTRPRPRLADDLPPALAAFDEGDWPDARPDGAEGSARQWARLRWNRARDRWRRIHPNDRRKTS